MSSSNEAAYLRWKLGLSTLQIQPADRPTKMLIINYNTIEDPKIRQMLTWKYLNSNWSIHYPGYTLIEAPIDV